ncbi:hypothetical protein MVLG_03432 [Microbotryum lychnidis-dioicae p1A1 Lamole]|uniref:Uncharacterized protein n=1 Tax=Microbotryum lychnidis-dioicae (strain p1A1 Lamole / MvSl-1064) TaxID=683840 RepID=U5H865_USTV1|nr:hypothetical protein MVLG_03432 [Microbotryum lychnidis-dioicae p1A1 Lamole]|eukprot:KDE06273.1 hypothetical protein MVLG_03432 [Microbotryum lychnidis-dioicae p1A1 Lamole]
MPRPPPANGSSVWSSSTGKGRMLSPSSAPSAAPAAPVAGPSASGRHHHAVSSVGGSTSGPKVFKPSTSKSPSFSLELVPSKRKRKEPSQSHSSRSQTRVPATAQPTASTSKPALKPQPVKAQPNSMLRLQDDKATPTEASSSSFSSDEESSSAHELLLHEAKAKSQSFQPSGPAVTASCAGSAPLCAARINIKTKAKVEPPPRMLKARSNKTKKVTIVSTVRGDNDSSLESSSSSESSSESSTDSSSESSSGSTSNSESESGSGSSSSPSSPRARQPPKKKRLIASESSSSGSSTRASMSPKARARVIAPPSTTKKEQIQTKRPRAPPPSSSASGFDDSSEDSESLSNSASSSLSKARTPIAKASSSSSESSSGRSSSSTSSSSSSTSDAPAALSPPPLKKVTRKRPRIIESSKEESDNTRNKVETLPRNGGSEMMTEVQAACTTSASARRSKDAVRRKPANAQRPQLVERALHLKSALEAEGKLAKPQKVSTPSARAGAGLTRHRDTSTGSSPIVQRAAWDGPPASTSRANERISQAASAASRLHPPPIPSRAPTSSLASAPNSRVVPARNPLAEPTSQSPETAAPKRKAAPAAPAPAARPAAAPKPSTAARPPRSAIRFPTFELVVPVMQLPRKKRKVDSQPQVRVPRSPVISPVVQPNLDGDADNSTLGVAMEQSGSTSSASISSTPLSSTSMAPVSTPEDHRMGSMVVDTKPIVRKMEMALAPEPVPPLAPVAPVEPIISIASAGPVALVPPVAPVAPVAPLTSIAPAAPIAPVAPAVPLAPAAPAISVVPARSSAHVVVATPIAVAAPVASVAPVTQAAPVIDGRPTLRPLGGPPGIELRNIAPPAPPDTRFNPLLEYFTMPAHLLGYAVRPYDPNNKGKGKARALSSVPLERLPTPTMFASADLMSAESFGLRRTQRVAQQALRPCDVPAPFSVTPLAASAAESTSSSADDDDDGTDSDPQDDTNHYFDFVFNTRRGHPELDRQLLSFEIDYGSDNEEDFAELDRGSIVGRELEEGKGYTTPWRLDGIDEGRRGITRALEIDAGMNGRFFAVARPTPSPELIRAWEASQSRPPAKAEKSKKRSAVVETDSEFEMEDGEVAEDSGSDYAKGRAKSCRAVAAQANARPQPFIPPRLHRNPTHFASVPDPFDLGSTSKPPAFSTIVAPPAALPRLKRAGEVAAKVLPNEPTVPPLGPANRTLPQPSVSDTAHAAIPPRSRSTSPVTHLAPQPWAGYQPNAQSQTHTQQLFGSAPLHPALRATVSPHSPTTHVSQPSAYPSLLSQLSLSHSHTLASTRRSAAHPSAYKPTKDLVRIPMMMQRNVSPFLHVSALSRPTSSSSVSATESRSSMGAVDPRSKARGIPGIRPLSLSRPPIVGNHMSGSQRPAQAESTV